ncbi:MAG: hypothetical protein H6942_14335 [Candidatus Accumulibacter sp.]|uniref:hypothetical protein n=1 Tax=Accumulibacter sp. TaxID=2053492 RepID=UPI0025EBF52D|nr:hypothetical protein [Accumulibacter sp.]MCP5249690.1 hypothetical protein [Accumulibacter sp.]
MRVEPRVTEIATATTADEAPGTIVCGSCARELPGDSPYCPYCCGEDGRRGASGRGAFLGGLFGVLAGGLITAVWSSAVGPEQTAWRSVLAIIGGCVTVGVIVGVIRSRKG